MTTYTSLKEFRTHLRTIREAKGLSQSQLSRYAGLELTTIQEIESGYADPEFIVLLTIAGTLEVELSGISDI